jgi:hypothetical protein
VNEVRKQTVERWPEFSKRCRAIIKQWQKLAEYNRPGSSCGGSSNGGTPQLISPALRNKGLTPKTPGKQQSQQQYQRVTSATLPPPRGYKLIRKQYIICRKVDGSIPSIGKWFFK